MNKQFGHWIVTEEGIEWDRAKEGNYFIPSNRLLELTDRSGVEMYDWLIHVPEKTWVSKQDALDLNDAFNHLAFHLNLEIDKQIYDDTIEYQINI